MPVPCIRLCSVSAFLSVFVSSWQNFLRVSKKKDPEPLGQRLRVKRVSAVANASPSHVPKKVRASIHRQVFWLPGRPTRCAFPSVWTVVSCSFRRRSQRRVRAVTTQ